MAFQNSVEEGGLVEGVRLFGVHIKVAKHLNHCQRLRAVLNYTCAKYRALLEVLFIFQLRYVDAVVTDCVDDI